MEKTENEAHEVELRGDAAPPKTERVRPMQLAKDLESLGYTVHAVGDSDSMQLVASARLRSLIDSPITVQVLGKKKIS